MIIPLYMLGKQQVMAISDDRAEDCGRFGIRQDIWFDSRERETWWLFCFVTSLSFENRLGTYVPAPKVPANIMKKGGASVLP